MARTPAIVVVLTAPIPTRRMPSFPAGSAIFGEFFTIWNYIIKFSEPYGRHLTRPDVAREEAPMFKWFRPAALDPLSVSMAGAKLGDRVLVVGCGDPHLVAGARGQSRPHRTPVRRRRVAGRATEAGRVALKEGALVETSTAIRRRCPSSASPSISL